MNRLKQYRMNYGDPVNVVINLTDKPLRDHIHDGKITRFIAKPKGDTTALIGMSVILRVDSESITYALDSLNKFMQARPLDLFIEYPDKNSLVAIVLNGDKQDFTKLKITCYGFTNAELKELAGDDWDEISADEELKTTFAHMARENKKRQA